MARTEIHLLRKEGQESKVILGYRARLYVTNEERGWGGGLRILYQECDTKLSGMMARACNPRTGEKEIGLAYLVNSKPMRDPVS